YADIVLPATTQLEHFDIHGSYGHLYVQASEPAIAPLAEAKCNTDVFRLLARALNFEPELFEVSDRQLAEEALAPWTSPRLYPRQLLSPPTPPFLNSSFVTVASLRKRAGEPTVAIHPEDAAARGIVAGQRVSIFNDRGRFLARAVVDAIVKKGVVVSEGVWW